MNSFESFIALLVGLATSSSSALACRLIIPVQDSDKKKATTVFVGEPINYFITKKNDTAKITFKVVETLRGEKRNTWDVTIASNTNWSIPSSLEELKKCFGAKAEVGVTIPTIKSKDALAVQGVCNPPYIISLTGKGMNCIP